MVFYVWLLCMCLTTVSVQDCGPKFIYLSISLYLHYCQRQNTHQRPSGLFSAGIQWHSIASFCIHFFLSPRPTGQGPKKWGFHYQLGKFSLQFFFFLKAMYLWCMFLHENNLILTALWFNSPSCPGKSPIDIHWIQHTLNLSTQGSQSLFVIYTELQKQDVVKLHKLEY